MGKERFHQRLYGFLRRRHHPKVVWLKAPLEGPSTWCWTSLTPRWSRSWNSIMTEYWKQWNSKFDCHQGQCPMVSRKQLMGRRTMRLHRADRRLEAHRRRRERASTWQGCWDVGSADARRWAMRCGWSDDNPGIRFRTLTNSVRLWWENFRESKASLRPFQSGIAGNLFFQSSKKM